MRTIGISAESKLGSAENKTTRINFLAPLSLVDKIKELALELSQTQSDVIRQALERYISDAEKEKIGLEIEEACKFYYEADKQLADEWRGAESEI